VTTGGKAGQRQVHVFVDCRPLLYAPLTGIGRFTLSLVAAAKDLAASRQADETWVLHLVAPAQLGMPSVTAEVVAPWLAVFARKPRCVWATVAAWWCWLKLRHQFRDQGVGVWIAPDNIDRPLFMPRFFSHRPKWLTLQIVHDLIPFHFATSSNRALRWQMATLLPLGKGPGVVVAPISDLTGADVHRRFPRLSVSAPLGLRIDQALWQELHRINQLSQDAYAAEFAKNLPHLWGHVAARGVRFVLGVGRDEDYKRWPLAAKIVRGWDVAQGASQDPKMPLIFVHVCTGTQRHADQHVLQLSNVSDSDLALLYRGAEALLHCSRLEGFGLPLAEAYAAGLPLRLSPHCGFRDVLRLLGDDEEVQFAEDNWQVPNMEREWSEAVAARTRRSKRRMSNATVQHLIGSNVAMTKNLERILKDLQVCS
jgi:glycosyltransferase involved in cell wall biosynthesis